ncbi:MAG: hypothetical protein HGA24_03550 [Candidatus Aminicenantes bacterium]|nr:hypothetical protein [Candidatus Aminicenantes bacterium]
MDNEAAKPGPQPETNVTGDMKIGEVLARVGCQPQPGEMVSIEVTSKFVPLTTQSFFGGGETHTCTLAITNTRLIFRDHNEKDVKYSFELSRADLEKAKLGRSGNTITIETADGTNRALHLGKGDVESVFAALGRETPKSTAGRDTAGCLLRLAIPIVWISAGIFLASRYQEHSTVILAIALGVPLMMCGFLFGRGGTVFVVVVLAISAVWNAIDGTYPIWISVVVLVAFGGLSLIGESLRAVVARASRKDNAAKS